METNREDIIRKIAACLRLAERGGTSEEAIAAATAAQRLMDKYNIEQESINLANEGHPANSTEDIVDFSTRGDGELESGKNQITPWKRKLATVLCKHNGCFMFHSFRGGRRSIELVGRPTNVGAVRYMYSWLNSEIDNFTKIWGAGMGHTWCQEFRIGVVETLDEKLKESKEDTFNELKREHGNNPHALMIVERAIANVGLRANEAANFANKMHRFTYGRIRSNRGTNLSARDEGRFAGHSIDVNRPKHGIGGGKKELE